HVPHECEKREEWVCRKCKGHGHGFWECPKRQSETQPHCYLCNETGHQSNACTNTEKWVCNICSGTGHQSAACPRLRAQKGRICTGCGESGHSLSQCSKSTCFKCGIVGHIASSCTKKAKKKKAVRFAAGPRAAGATAGASRRETSRERRQTASSAPSATSEPQPSTSRTERSEPEIPKPAEPETAPDSAPQQTPAADHDEDCRCMLCNLVKRRKAQEKPPAPSQAPPLPRAAQAESTGDASQVNPHAASCTCSICKLTRKGGGKPNSKENVPPPGTSTGNSSRTAAGTGPETTSRHGPDCGCTPCTRKKNNAKQTSAEYSKDQEAMSLWMRGTSALASGQTVRAIRLFDQCIAKDPGAAAFFRSRGDAYNVLKDHAAALGDYQRALQLLKAALPATAASVLVKIAHCHLSLGAPSAASLAVRNALSADPANEAALALKKRVSGIDSGVEAYQGAKARRQWKAVRLAYEACRKAYEAYGGGLPVEMRCYEVEVDVAEAKWAEALAARSAILAIHPKSIEALLMRALVLFLTADLGEAVKQTHAALKLDPDNADAKAARTRYKSVMDLKEDGNGRFRTGDLTGAIAKWTSALSLVAEKEEEGNGGRIRSTLLLNRSRARLKVGQHPDALKDVNAAGKLDPDNVKIVVTRARIYVGLELFDTAIQDFKDALQADASKLGAGDRQTVQSELEDVEQRAVRERLKVRDYYEILGLDRNCTTADIRKAYRVQSLKHHPDKGGVAEKFRLVTEAYTKLSDPISRRNYDAKLPPKSGSSGFSGG
ncbi:uncharacterized protein C8Q71DRAFT_889623, partial [Rhodofomes roseus]